MSKGALRLDSNFRVSSLEFEICEPTLYICNELPEPKYTVTYDNSIFRINVNGRNRNLDIASEFLRKIRHEIVSDVMEFESDTPLRTIGVVGEESELTPDFINIESKKVMELTTTAISEMFSLKRAYNGKFVKYNYLVEPLGFDLCILVVSPSRVYCNFKLTQDIVNCLCYRVRIGIAIESIVSEYLGTDMFSDDLPLDEAVVKDVFRGINLMPNSTKDFDLKTIQSCGETPTKQDMAKLGKILKHSLDHAARCSEQTESTLLEYLEAFEENSKANSKRVCNIPMISQYRILKYELDLDPSHAKDMPLFLKKIWSEALNIEPMALTEEQQFDEAMGYATYEKHRVQKSTAFNCRSITDEDRIEASKTGLWAKSLTNEPHLVEKTLEDKKSFHPTLTNTRDIEEFINTVLLVKRSSSIFSEEIRQLLMDGKRLWGRDKPMSIRVVNRLTSTTLINFAQTISNCMTEICYCHKYWIKRADFYHKEINGIHIIVRCTGAHIFVSYAFPKLGCENIDTGRIGPTIWESKNYYFTDICSYSEPVIEHFVKAGPYIASIVCHLMSHLEFALDKMEFGDKILNQHINTILLLYLNNKTDSEELVTSQRYLTMGVLEEVDPNPWRFCERLPEVIRSRLTCYLLKKTVSHMRHYENNRIIKVPSRDKTDYDVGYTGIQSLFGDYEPTFKQKVNEFYFGYVVSKEKGRGNDRNFKIMKKIVSEEYRYRDTVNSTFSTSLEPQVHVSNDIVIKCFVYIFKAILKTYLGKDYQQILTLEVTRALSKITFDDLATLKVSSRSYSETIIVPSIKEAMDTHEIRTLYEKCNPEETRKRPRAMESIKMLVDEYSKSTGKVPKHPIDLVPYCLKDIEKRGYWDSDIFPKSQHGGDREIHVLEMKMRVLQLFVETISRALCRLVPSDTLTHPYEKESFVKKHYKESTTVLGDDHFSLGKSADATKWCQRNDSTKFAAVVCPFLPELYQPFFLRIMALWKKKRLTFPIQFAANFQANRTTKSNPVYERMRREFQNGTGIFTQIQSNKVTIKSGMMQGILHYTSSFVHSVIQEVMKKLQMDYLHKRGLSSVITVVQGSDDSAELISIKGKISRTKLRLATTMLHWKEQVSKYFSIYTSRAKSSIGTLDLIEYNSEWYVRNNVIKPTFRWASACLETTVTERFIDRVRINYNVSSQVLEGGGKVLEVAMLQLCQAWMHYMLIGLHTSKLAPRYCKIIKRLKDPSLGYYPLDSDFIAGITGVEFQLYKLVSCSSFGQGMSFANIHEPTTRIEEDEVSDQSVAQVLRSVVVKFSDAKLWKDQLRRMQIPDLEVLVKEVEKNPWLIYATHKSWDEAKYSIFLKMFQPGVKESISKHSAAARIMSASAYMINRPCVSIVDCGFRTKTSLLKACYIAESSREDEEKNPIETMFMHHAEYKEVLDYVNELETNTGYLKAELKTRSKQKICVFEKAMDDIPIIDLCRKVWFGIGRLPLSSRQVRSFWAEAKAKYPFLRDSRSETKELLEMNEVELKNFLESITSKPRHIVLLDTSARSASLYNSVTRIFWTGVKLVIKGRSDLEETSFALRSKIFSVISSWYTHAEKIWLIKRMIENSNLLSKLRVPTRVHKLKIIHKWLNGSSKQSVSRMIMENSLGTIGFFTARQKGWGKTRTGYGEWRGRVIDSSVMVRMDGNYCTSIIVNKLTNLRQLGQSLSELIESFSLEHSTELTDGDHWLTRYGKIIGGYGRSKGIPLIVDPTLDVSIVDKIADYSWSLQVSNNRLRLIADYDVNLKITVLSIPFSGRDWDPMFEVDDDKLLSNWSSGTPISIQLIEEELHSVIKQTPGDVLRAYRMRYRTNTRSNWNLAEFMSAVKNQLFKVERLPDDPEPELMEDADMEDDLGLDDLDIEAMLNEINTDIQGELFIDLEGKFDDENEFDADLFQADASYINGFELQVSLFENVDRSDEAEIIDFKTMPQTNLCLSSINRLTLLTLGISTFEEAVTKFKQDQSMMTPGILGTLLSLFTGRSCIQTYDTNTDIEVMNIEQEASILVGIMTEETNISNLPEEQLVSYIEFITESMERAEPRLRNRLKSSKRKFEYALEAVRRSRDLSSDLESIKTDELIIKLKPILLQYSHMPETFNSLPSSVFLTIFKNELDHSIDKKCSEGLLSLREQSVYREAVRKSYVTSLLIDSILFRYNIGLMIKGYNSTTNDSLNFTVDENLNFIYGVGN